MTALILVCLVLAALFIHALCGLVGEWGPDNHKETHDG